MAEVTLVRSDRRHAKFDVLLANYNYAVRHGSDEALALHASSLAEWVSKNAEHTFFEADPPRAPKAVPE